jgi:hypothetical protein
VLAVTGSYEVSLVVTGVERMSNVSPPTLLLALHCTWMSCAFVAAAGAIRRWAGRPRVWHVVAVGNGGAMTLYISGTFLRSRLPPSACTQSVSTPTT